MAGYGVPSSGAVTDGSLARLMATRGRLSPGEVVTIATPLAQALAALHARGVVHGEVTPAHVHFTGDGRPTLGDPGVGRTADPAGEDLSGYGDPALDPGPAGDVHGLAATCLGALTGEAPYDPSGQRRRVTPRDRLTEVLEQAMHPDPGRRPASAELAAAVFDAAPAEPVRLVGPAEPVRLIGPSEPVRLSALDGGAARRRGRHARVEAPPSRRTVTSWRRGLAVLTAGAAVGMAVATGFAWPAVDADPLPAAVSRDRLPEPTAGAAPRLSAASSGRLTAGATATPAAARWIGVLARLDRMRSAAFAAGDLQALDRVYAAGSPARRRDHQLLRRLVSVGLRAQGLRLQVEQAIPTGLSHDVVTLRVVDRLGPYRLVDPAGQVVHRRAGRGSVAWLVILRRERGGWLVSDVRREPAAVPTRSPGR